MAQASGSLSSTFHVADDVPLNSHHGDSNRNRDGSERGPLSTSSVAVHKTAHPFPQTGAPHRAQVLSHGAMEEPASLPKMSAFERADLSHMARRNFSSDLEAYRFWRDLVTTAAFFHAFGGR